MYDNRNWPWQYQDKPITKTLYDGFFGVVSNASQIDVLNLLNPDALSGTALLFLANMYNIRSVGGVITDAFTWDVSKWNDDTKFWNGAMSATDDEFFRRYIKMKMTLFGRPFCIETIKLCLDILLESNYKCDIIENEFSFDINITISDANLSAILDSTIALDPFMFGKPSGYSYKINVTQG